MRTLKSALLSGPGLLLTYILTCADKSTHACLNQLRNDDSRVIVVGFLGNHCTFDAGVAEWSASPAHVCDIVVTVPLWEQVQTVYARGDLDDEGVARDHMSGHIEVFLVAV